MEIFKCKNYLNENVDDLLSSAFARKFVGRILIMLLIHIKLSCFLKPFSFSWAHTHTVGTVSFSVALLTACAS